MDKLLEVRIGGGKVRSGMVPLDAFALLKDLLEAIAAENKEHPDPAAWVRELNPHLEIVGKGSTRVAVRTNFAKRFRRDVQSFEATARKLDLGPKGVEFVARNIRESVPWTYVEVSTPDQARPGRVLRFDTRYKERLLKRQAERLAGIDEVYAYIIRAGGEKRTMVTMEILGKIRGTFAVASRDLARRLGAHLYDTLKLRVEANWDAESLDLLEIKVLDVLDWENVHLADLYERNGRQLPIDLSVDSVEELLRERHEDRSE